MRSLSFFALLVLLPLGCRSHVLSVNLTNISQQPVSTIIVDYPGATFGKEQLGPGKTYQYAIKPQDTGPLKIQFTDPQDTSTITPAQCSTRTRRGPSKSSSISRMSQHKYSYAVVKRPVGHSGLRG
jgi:hypothetical protein